MSYTRFDQVTDEITDVWRALESLECRLIQTPEMQAEEDMLRKRIGALEEELASLKGGEPAIRGAA